MFAISVNRLNLFHGIMSHRKEGLVYQVLKSNQFLVILQVERMKKG